MCTVLRYETAHARNSERRKKPGRARHFRFVHLTCLKQFRSGGGFLLVGDLLSIQVLPGKIYLFEEHFKGLQICSFTALSPVSPPLSLHVCVFLMLLIQIRGDKMLDFFTIFSKGGIVLWCFQGAGVSESFTGPVNALIRSVILQVGTQRRVNIPSCGLILGNVVG